MKRIVLILVLVLVSLSYSCKQNSDSDTLFQVNSFALFYEGDYDGFYTYSKILEHGNFGIGTFDRLDGEMVLLDGDIYRIEAEGNAIRVGPEKLAPVATFCYFDADIVFEAEGLSLEELKIEIDKHLPDLNLFYAIRIEGEFDTILTRSIFPQDKPYRVLPEVIKEEVRQKSQMVVGTAVGFRAPQHMEEALWKDYHMHFISQDFSFGGHIHEASLVAVTVKIDMMTELHLILKD